MPKIILLNIGTEHVLSEDWTNPHSLLRSAWRHVWFADARDIIVSPVHIAPEFLRHVGDVLGFDPNTVTTINKGQLLWDDQLLCPDLISNLQSRVCTNGTWSLMPCFHTEGVARLACALGFSDSDGLRFAAQRGSDLLNRKTHFRQLATGARIPLASGTVVHTPRTLSEAIERHLPETGTVIVKRANAAGGMGNITVTTRLATPMPGARETWSARNDIETMATELWEQLADPANPGLVVESYHMAAERFYFEYLIHENGLPQFLSSGNIRLHPNDDPNAKELIWVGLDIPANLPPFSLGKGLTMSAQLVALFSQIGYRGHINVDAIITEKGEIIFNEANARWGGGTVLHAVGLRLLGDQYADRHVLSSVRDIQSPPRPSLIRILQQCGLYFDQKSKEGALILACDEFRCGPMECLLLGPSHSRVREIELCLRQAVTPRELQRNL